MSSHMKIALAAALILGTASAALANDNERDQPASASQAERDWQESHQALFRNHMGNGGAVYDYIGTPHRTQSQKSR
jgi:hypothetical protein